MLKILLWLPRLETRSFGSLIGGVGAVVCATTSAYGQSKPARARLMINLESSPPPPVYMSGIICVKRFHKDSLKVKNQSHIVAKIKKKR